ncbi:MAG: polysaccharide deacetylase [Lachnospiraceae bacterium]|nr:polysaccharide deacetylase [Lachnospiraceae bacterium]MDD3616093.1 polysaccharide deacetylase [Lachnospiraceae bacterium]
MDEKNNRSSMEQRRMAKERKERIERRRRAKKKAMMRRMAILIGLIVLVLGCIVGVTVSIVSKNRARKAEEKAQKEAEIVAEEAEFAKKKDLVAQADAMAAGYDYDGAIALLQGVEGYDNEPDMIEAIARYAAAKSTLVEVDPDKVTHVFYHSLVVDPTKGFVGENANGFNAWMTTLDEFNKITQEMYDNGYVLIRLRDLVTQTTDADGTVHFTENKLMLPADKKPYVLSVDDLSYYHSYEGHGVASKLIVDENGLPKCEYIEDDGSVSVGDYDVVPAMNTFLEAHPDGAYKGARGMIALTGYNGVFGYRTDVAYRDHTNLTADQQAWLDANPDFNWDTDVAEATKVAEAIKATGWEFASHTWGHLRVGSTDLATLQTDTDKWFNTVSPIVGPVDTIIFAHGEDLGSWRDYDSTNEKYNYFKSKGFNLYCNVDSSQYWIQIRDGYVRQGRRNLDGYLMYKSMTKDDNLEDLFHVEDVFDSVNRPTPVTLE